MTPTQALLQQLETNPDRDLDLRPYAGQWVVLRRGRLVAHGDDLVAIADRIQEDDAVMPVGHVDRPLLY
jgi:hypothetical protein